MSERSAFDGQRQADALSAFQRDAGLDATKAARAVNLSYPQYNRYLWGKVPLRTDQIASFAAAYRVPKAELTRALGLMDDDIDPVLLARASEALGPEQTALMPERANDIARELAKHEPDVQADALRQVSAAILSRAGDVTA